ncbi:hypothetical protein [Chlorobium phaeobacteroides]|uniref:Uncharacterized protein n=1 Tax=Chlorobium phaeobacteroides (strain DSM 266 / SMG 266 / 2430) TaxID=290317 RepID=A1BEH8_CHLPD|nr:hypothetical protein [Chlorobium phaeobacteroides]ABL64805.1 hypothetical protein Cpha266_0752 [Chlorobium phaeobacteroides DSM 266]
MARKIVSSYAVFENLGGTRDIAFYYESGGADSVSGVSAAEADYIVGLLRNEKPVSYDHSLKRLSTGSIESVGESEEPVPNIDTWLSSRPLIAGSIVWEDTTGAHAWSSWSESQKAELRLAFTLAWNRNTIAVADVPLNQAVMGDEDQSATVLSQGDARAYFTASVAHSLVVEIQRQVGWSIEGYNTALLAQLFDSREMFRWNGSPAGYRIDHMHGHLVPASPSFSYAFLGSNSLIAPARIDTIGRLVGWCRDNLVHFSGGTTAANMEDQWQYRGYPPLSRVINGTLQLSHPQFGMRHRTAGCWGTVGLFRTLLRVVNIPVKLVTNAGHAQPWFMADSRYLSHGDDPYNALTRSTPPYAADELFIDQARFDAWFGAGVSNEKKEDNIGRRPRELAIVHLPNYLLHARCDDLHDSKSHSAGKVYEIFSRDYTVAELEAQNLWMRMDAKIASFGGCSHLP